MFVSCDELIRASDAYPSVTVTEMPVDRALRWKQYVNNEEFSDVTFVR